MLAVDPALERSIRDAYAAFARGDLDTALATFLPDATFTNPSYAVEGGVRAGRDQVRSGFQALRAEFDYASIDIEDIVQGPTGVLVIARVDARGRTSGAPLDDRFFHVLRMEAGRVVDFAWFLNADEGRRAVGL